jgi:CubicO group peptidase (beta-lactamase class C family)
MYLASTLFDEGKIVANFRSMTRPGSFPWREAKRGPNTSHLKTSDGGASPEGHSLPSHFEFKGTRFDLEQWIQDHWMTGLVVLQMPEGSQTEATIMHERYLRGNAREDKVISWSVGKSVVSALVGIALADGKLGDLETAVSDIVPELKGSGYEGVRLKDVLQMASGIRFNEDYADFFSDINRMGRALALGTSVQDFVRSLQRQFPPGTTNHYVSMDTQVLGLCLRRAVGMPLTQYLEEKLWVRCGMESDVRWSLDNEKDQMELAFGTLHATTRDYARFGWLYLNEGASPLDGRQVVPQEWVRASVTPDGPHVQPGPSNKQRAGIQHEPAFGYGYQWWLPGKLDHPDEVAGDFMAIGVYNQFIYVSPEHRVVVAMNCAYADYDKGSNELDSEAEAVEAFRAIARHFSVRECSSSS